MFEMDESDFEEMEHQERLKHDDKVKEIMEEKKMTDEEKAEDRYCKTCKKKNNCFHNCDVFIEYTKGLAEGRKGKEKLREYAKFLQDTYCGIDRELAEIKKENAELKAQIEKMKLCENCKHWVEPFESKCICIDCHKMNKWEVNNV